ncbi:MAG: AbrB/MazE/SpoVT family DNA-binding domain-containing protein [Gammaproteobacteria bacterium]|nr:AbrB/MazE/SpoVT family DNA-binding domain-containing protein [Gammaproteobacteria bacterium]
MHHHTRVFKSGNSLAIRIPKSFDLSNHQEVEIFVRNNELIVRIVPKNLADAFLALSPFPDDVLVEGVEDLPPQKRDF